MTLAYIKEELGTEHVSRKKDGTYRFWVSYYYRHGMTSEGLEAKVIKAIPTAEIVSSGDHWHAFKGGAKSGSACDSFMYVIFKVA